MGYSSYCAAMTTTTTVFGSLEGFLKCVDCVGWCQSKNHSCLFYFICFNRYFRYRYYARTYARTHTKCVLKAEKIHSRYEHSIFIVFKKKGLIIINI